MNLYLDASVILRAVLGQAGALPLPAALEQTVTSVLVRVECARTLDRLRFLGELDDEASASANQALRWRYTVMTWIPLSPSVLDRAAQPLRVALGTLDALHRASAILWREATGQDVAMATHDRQLALAARASGLDVVGVTL